MTPAHRRLLAAVLLVAVLSAAAWLALYAAGLVPKPGGGDHFRMSDRIADLEVERTADGPRFRFGDELLTPDEFARELAGRRPTGRRGAVYSALNITGTAGLFWVGIGLLGQVLFTGRMVVQWLASEREKRSVVPVAFWWMSLGGASMLIVYFVWRVDIVGILGQCTGWFIYVRNLWLIYGRNQD